MAKLNCWEFKQCGRQPGGANANGLGVCPAATEARLNWVNFGIYGGRFCWAATGTQCGGKAQGTFAAKVGDCKLCDFYKAVAKEEGPALITSLKILERLK